MPIFNTAKILLPLGDTDMSKWAALACDQFTSEPEYWLKAEDIAKNAPSTLHMVLPEVYLEKPDKSLRIGKIHDTMTDYASNVVVNEIDGYIYVRRTTASGVREGIVGAVDLEAYSFEKGAKPAIRPTEKTVVDRIPPRIAVRRGATLESPHILMLIDDDKQQVIEPIYSKCSELQKLYDFDLMLGGGHIEGYAITDDAEISRIDSLLHEIGTQSYFDTKYPDARSDTPLAMAVGDGNHSLATAKAFWEELKNTLSKKELASHPARYCLVELVNIHCKAIVIEPIHRVIFGVSVAQFNDVATDYFKSNHCSVLARPVADCQSYVVVGDKKDKEIHIKNPPSPLAVGTLDKLIEQLLIKHPYAKVDYVHDEESVRSLCKKGAVGVMLPPFDKSDIFKGVIMGGVLPKKTFSMGSAKEKRYYLECRKIK